MAATEEQIKKQKESLLNTLDELNKLEGDQKIQELASLVYGLVAVHKIKEILKEAAEKGKLQDEILESSTLLKVSTAVSAYVEIGKTFGFCGPKQEEEDVSK